jgi:hypothetical protein
MQTASKIRSKLCLPCDVSDGTHVLDRNSGSVHRNISFMPRYQQHRFIFPLQLRAPDQDTPLAMRINDMLNAVASQMVVYFVGATSNRP